MRQRRLALGWGHKKLAKKLDMTQAALSQIEAGLRRFDILLIATLSKALEMPPDQLLPWQPGTRRLRAWSSTQPAAEAEEPQEE